MRVAIVLEHPTHTADQPAIVESLQRAFSGQISPPEAADVVISTSRVAARSVIAPPATPHICYLAHAGAFANLSPAESPQRLDAANLSTSAVAVAQTKTQALVGAAQQGITHFLAGNGVAAAQLRREIDRQVKVIYPAVDTHLFRPRKQRRSEHYLMIADADDTPALETAIAAARVAGRRLVVATKPHFKIPRFGREQSHVQFATVGEESILYQLLCECRAFLSLRSAGFDANVIRAQACGTPVIVPAAGGIAELVLDAEQEGPGTGLLFDPLTPESVASAMLELERRPHKCSGALASAHAQAFSPARFAGEIRAFVEAVLASMARHAVDELVAGEQRRAA